MKKPIWIHIIFLLVFSCGTWSSLRAEAAVSLADCVKCHEREPREIATQGMAHKEQVTCLDCHPGHRPQSPNNIPACSNCHDVKPHAAMVDCASCHKPKKNCQACHQPHRPLAQTLGKIPQLHCKVCHPEPYRQLQANTTKHHELVCGVCHVEHRAIPNCSNCHGQPHESGTHRLFQCGDCHGTAHELQKLVNKKG